MQYWICSTCGSQFTTIVNSDAKNAVLRSADRYIRAVEEGL